MNKPKMQTKQTKQINYDGVLVTIWLFTSPPMMKKPYKKYKKFE